MDKGRIAILDDEPAVREILGEFLRSRGYGLVQFARPEQLYAHLESQPVDVLVCDLYLGEVTGLDVIKELRPRYPDLDILVLTGFASVDNVIEAFRLGAKDYLQKPVNLLLFETAVERQLEKKRLTREVVELKDILQIHQMAESSAAKENLPQLLDMVVRTAVRGIAADSAMLLFREGKGASARVEVGASEGVTAEDLDRVRNAAPEKFDAWMRVLGKPEAEGEQLRELLGERWGNDASLVIPMRQRGEVAGALCLRRDNGTGEFTASEVNSTQLLASNAALAIENARLYGDLEQGYLSSIRSLARALEAKDPYTGGHAERVARYSRMLAELGGFPEETIRRLESAALLHDLGKIGISDHVLQKQGPLTAEERAEIERHPTIGERILSEAPSLAQERLWIYEHHERWDGSGYPRGLRGDEISRPGRILIMVEVYDALATKRSYKEAWPAWMIAEYFQENRGTLFCPETTDLFVELLNTKLAHESPAEEQ